MSLNFLKRFLFTTAFSVFLLGNVFLFFPQITRADETLEWQITDYQVIIKPIVNDYKIEVTETITGDFYTPHNGIYRYIPVYMKDTAFTQARLLIDDVDVKIDGGQNHPFDYTDNGQIYFKIGDPDVTFTGPRTYDIDYTILNGGWRYFEDKQEAEIYWNAVGTDWPVNIEKVQVIYDFSDWSGIDLDQAPAECYTGVYGSSEQACNLWVEGQKLIVESTRLLMPYEGLTVALALPLNLVPQASVLETIMFWIKANGIAFFPYLWLIAMIYVWYRWGNDSRDKRAVVVEYSSADELPPAAMYQVLKQSHNTNYMVSEIIYLATRKYLKIKKTEVQGFFGKKDDYVLVLEKKDYRADQNLAEYQKSILDLLFIGSEAALAELKTEFSFAEAKGLMRSNPSYYQKQFSQIKKEIDSYVSVYFEFSPKKALVFMGIFCGSLAFSLFFILPFVNEYLISLIFVNLMITEVLLFLIAYFGLPKYTEQGKDVHWKLKGLVLYLKTAEAERFKFGELTDLFEKLLPYAISIGLLKKWLKIMADIYKTPPEWYSDKDFSTLGMAGLAGSLSDMGNSLNSTMSSMSSSGSSGGGSSGGGGGGGGGGGW